MNNVAHLQAHHVINRAHFLGVALDEVIVDGDHVNRLPAPGEDRNRQRCGKRLTFTGRHFGNGPFDHRQCADELDREWPQPQRPNGRLAGQCHGTIQGLALETVQARQVTQLGNGFIEGADPRF